MKVEKCMGCGKLFTFVTSKCSQIILRRGRDDAVIVFLPRCPHCLSMHSVKLPWDKYGYIDY